MRMFLVGIVAMLALQALLVPAYLWLARDNLIILSLDRGALVEDGVMMAMVCGEGSGRGFWIRFLLTGVSVPGRREELYGETVTSGIIILLATADAERVKSPSTILDHAEDR